MSHYSIKNLESLSGIKAHTLRIWEQRYHLLSPERTETNIRFYDDKDLKLILNIALLKEHGYKISEIAKLTLEELSAEVMLLFEKPLNYPEQIHALTIALIDMDEMYFEKTMATNILQLGFENTMIQIVYPFLIRIGSLWRTGSVGPAKEHFMSNLIRQKMIVAIDGQTVKPDSNSKKYILFTPEGEMHEMSILFANYILRARNNRVIYLGLSLPFDELEMVVKQHQPDFIFTALTSSLHPENVQNYLDTLANSFPNVQILITGHQVIDRGLSMAQNLKIIPNITQLIEIAKG
jgi:MerR family transcriptional regulator, light-induced transcriptional regulator